MPSPAERPDGSRPWWREPFSPQDPGPEDPRVPPPTLGAPGHLFTPSRARVTDPAEPVASPVFTREDAVPEVTTTPRAVGPQDETIVMQPVPDATRELPPVPGNPSAGGPPGRLRGSGPPGRVHGSGPPGPARGFNPPGPARGFNPPGPRPAGAADAASTPRVVAAAQAHATATQAHTVAAQAHAAVDGSALSRLLGRLIPERGPLIPEGGPRWTRRSTLVVAGGVALTVLVVLVGAGRLLDRPGDQDQARPVGTQVTPIDLTTVRAAASSVLRRDGTITYDPGNTLDGDPSTAWNSDGKRDGRGPGITLTYAFSAPVDLHSITVRNGYQKVRAKDGVDLWQLNARVKRFQVTTDLGQWTWDVEDSREAQTLQRDFGRTETVRLKILQVYRSQYRDVAISEIAFAQVTS
jgi:hypothetical protein